MKKSIKRTITSHGMHWLSIRNTLLMISSYAMKRFVCLLSLKLNHAIDNLLVHLEQHITRSVFGNTGATALPRWFKKSSSSKTALWPNIMENVICVVVIILFC